MKICLAQSKAKPGNIQANLHNHCALIDAAAIQKAELIVFPELSILGYEPTLAAKLAGEINDPIFDLFQSKANAHKMVIAVGMPIRIGNELCISMLIFVPTNPLLAEKYKTSSLVYSKQILHKDEYPFFSASCDRTPVILQINDTKISFGICYETMQAKHFIDAKTAGADIYIASVAKSQTGIEKAYQYFARTSKNYATPILMVNSVGQCDSFISAGQSAWWNVHGQIQSCLSTNTQGLLLASV